MNAQMYAGSLLFVLVACAPPVAETTRAIDGQADAGQGGDGDGDDNEEEELFEELFCELHEADPYQQAVANAEEACREFKFMCTAEIGGLTADILGQVIPMKCGLEFPIGATIATAIGWDPNEGIFGNLTNPSLATDLICQVAECMGPTDPFTIGAKAICTCRSLARTIERCTELWEACDDAEAAIPIVDGNGEIINPHYQCPITPPTVAACANGIERDIEDILIDCAKAVDRRRDDIDNGGYGNCVSQCVNTTRAVGCGPPDDPPEEVNDPGL